MLKDLLSKISEYKEYAVEIETGLTAIPALDPTSGGEGEYDKAVWLEGELKKLKFDELYRIDAPQATAKNGVRPNIIAKYYGENKNKTLWIMTHLDVVPPGERSLWKTDPYKVHREGDKIYGRGVEDNQQGLVSSLLCVKAFMDLGMRPPVNIGLLFNADEETGSVYGTGYVLKNRPDIIGKDDMFFIPDGGNAEGTMVEIAEKSLLWLKIRTAGKQCHASMPKQGINAFRAASELVVKLNGLYRKFNAKEKLYTPAMSTFEPTKKEANVPNINTLPGDDVFYLDCRVLPQYLLGDVKAEIRRLADEVEKKRGVKITIEVIQEVQAPKATDPDCEFVKLVTQTVKEIYKVKAKPMGIGGGTVAAYFREAGYPAVVFSKLDDTAHMPNESCTLTNLVGDAQVFAAVAMRLK